MEQSLQNPPVTIPEIPDTKDSNIPSTAPKHTPIADIIHYITVKGLTYEDAGKVLGISGNAVFTMCKRHGIMSGNSLKIFKNNKAAVLETKQAQILHHIDEEAIKSMSGLQKATSFGILYDKARLEAGRSTANVAHLHAAKDKHSDILNKFTEDLSASVLEASMSDVDEDDD